MSLHEEKNLLASHFPVSVIMEQQKGTHSRWSVARWEVAGVVAGNNVVNSNKRKSIIRSGEGRQQYLWTGFVVELYKDIAESYWYNLLGKTPSLFVICRQGENEEIAPFTVTADYDEAGAHMEADDLVFSVKMPAEVYQWLERYVIDNYVPQEKKKRKRKNWKEESGYV